MDCVQKIYKVIELDGVAGLRAFMDEANRKFYEVVSVVHDGTSFVVVYKDYE